MAKNYDLKQENMKAVRKCFYAGGTWSLNELKQHCHLSHGSVNNVLKELEESGEIHLSEKTGTSVGRKTYRYTLSIDFLHLCMISIHRQKSVFLYDLKVTDLAGCVKDKMSVSTDTFDSNCLMEAISRIQKRHPEISMFLISSPGICWEGVIYNEGKYEVDLGRMIRERWQIPYVIENDVNVASIGFQKKYPGDRNLAFIYQAAKTIFGCGLIIHGRLYNGFSHAAGELRYFPFMRYVENRTAEGLLKEQILSTAAVFNPEIIGYYSEVTDEEITIGKNEMPLRHKPQLKQEHDMNALIDEGLLSIGLYNISENNGGFYE